MVPWATKLTTRHRALLSQPVHPADALLEHGRVPGQIEVDNDLGELQVQAHAARVRRQKHPALRVVAEAVDQLLAFVARHAAVKHDKIPAALPEPPPDNLVHAAATG